jgi:beta-N-acetylhexosaminidase
MGEPGAFIAGCRTTGLTADEAAFFREADPWGFILFTRNIATPAQLRALTTQLREAVGRDAPVLIDQEGGRVARMGPPHWRSWHPPLDQVARTAPGTAARSLYLRYRIIAAELRDAGIDVDCAPVADIAGRDTHPFLRNRCYGETPTTVIGGARAVAQGLLAGGVLPVLKHMPGHGRATADSHVTLPRVAASAETLAETDFSAFRALSDLPLGMTAHIVFDALDPERPATQSRSAIEAIRTTIGFDGLLMTDDIGMEALAAGMGVRADAARKAGCDLVLHCSGDLGEMRQVAAAAGQLEGASQARAARALAARTTPDEADIPGLEAELRCLIGDAANV